MLPEDHLRILKASVGPPTYTPISYANQRQLIQFHKARFCFTLSTGFSFTRFACFSHILALPTGLVRHQPWICEYCSATFSLVGVTLSLPRSNVGQLIKPREPKCRWDFPFLLEIYICFLDCAGPCHNKACRNFSTFFRRQRQRLRWCWVGLKRWRRTMPLH